MAGKTLIDGTEHKINGGTAMIGGTARKIVSGKAMINGSAYDIKSGRKRLLLELLMAMEAVGEVQGNNASPTSVEVPALTPTANQYVIAFFNGNLALYYVDASLVPRLLYRTADTIFVINYGGTKIQIGSSPTERQSNYGATIAYVKFQGFSSSEVQDVLSRTSAFAKTGRNGSSSSVTMNASSSGIQSGDFIIGAYESYITTAQVVANGTTVKLDTENTNIVSGAYSCLHFQGSPGNYFRIKDATSTNTSVSVRGGSLIALREEQ